MKRFIPILCVLACLQVFISCIAGQTVRAETTTEALTAVRTEQQMQSDGQPVTIQSTVADFIRELNGNKMPEVGSELTCCEFESGLDVLAFVNSSLLLHPGPANFPYDNNKQCYEYRSKSLRLEFKELGLEAGVIARIDIWFLKAYPDIEANPHYTILFKNR